MNTIKDESNVKVMSYEEMTLELLRRKANADESAQNAMQKVIMSGIHLSRQTRESWETSIDAKLVDLFELPAQLGSIKEEIEILEGKVSSMNVGIGLIRQTQASEHRNRKTTTVFNNTSLLYGLFTGVVVGVASVVGVCLSISF